MRHILTRIAGAPRIFGASEGATIAPSSMASHGVVMDGGLRVPHRALLPLADRLCGAALDRCFNLRVHAPKQASGGVAASLLSPGLPSLLAMLATWQKGGVWLPLSPTYPLSYLEHAFSLARPSVVFVDMGNVGNSGHIPEWTEIAKKYGAEIVEVPSVTANNADAAIEVAVAKDIKVSPPPGTSPSLIIMTSGTTGRPKGVVHTHASVHAMCASMTEAWRWSSRDAICSFLPLHHVHGLVNIVSTALYNTAGLELMPQGFNAGEIYDRILGRRAFVPTLLFGVPTVYDKLLAHHNAQPKEVQERFKIALGSHVRLVVSGSAALPPTVHARIVRELGAAAVVERYGMTETGMVLTNPIPPATQNVGHVGKPFPGVDVQVMPLEGDSIGSGYPNERGELLVRSPQLFMEYFGNPSATKSAFVNFSGKLWFRTGDLVERDASSGSYKILGRLSADILKVHGYKVSALEIEAVLLERGVGVVAECAVLGLSKIRDTEGNGDDIVAAVVTLKDSYKGSDEDAACLLENCAKRHLPRHAVPRLWKFMPRGVGIPRNALGKVNKIELREKFKEFVK